VSGNEPVDALLQDEETWNRPTTNNLLIQECSSALNKMFSVSQQSCFQALVCHSDDAIEFCVLTVKWCASVSPSPHPRFSPRVCLKMLFPMVLYPQILTRRGTFFQIGTPIATCKARTVTRPRRRYGEEKGSWKRLSLCSSSSCFLRSARGVGRMPEQS
jgi:hypothetical protein